MDVSNVKDVGLCVPTGLLMDLSCLATFNEEDCGGREVRMWYDNHPFLLEAENILLAQYPKNAKLEESILVDPRYADEKNFDLIEVKGYRKGRTIDILTITPLNAEGGCYNLINIKGVGARAENEPMVFNQDFWYDDRANKWEPLLDVMNISLDRRWGILGTYAGEKEFTNNLFKEYGLAQVPHIKLNRLPEGILPFPEMVQIVRGLKTNIRCDDFFPAKFQEKYTDPEVFANMDSKFFEVHKGLYREGKAIKTIGRIANNRYIDGKFTETENFLILPYKDEEELVNAISFFLSELISSAFIAMDQNEQGSKRYVQILEESTHIPLAQSASMNPMAFMHSYLSKKEFDEKYLAERSAFQKKFRKNVAEYLKN